MFLNEFFIFLFLKLLINSLIAPSMVLFGLNPKILNILSELMWYDLLSFVEVLTIDIFLILEFLRVVFFTIFAIDRYKFKREYWFQIWIETSSHRELLWKEKTNLQLQQPIKSRKKTKEKFCQQKRAVWTSNLAQARIQSKMGTLRDL